MPLTLLLGGARSGKSALAARLAGRWPGPVTVVATGQAGDAEMAERIRRHRAERPGHWATVEEPLALEAALAKVSAESFLVLDCLTLWVSNLHGQQGLDDGQVQERARSATRSASGSCPPAPWPAATATCSARSTPPGPTPPTRPSCWSPAAPSPCSTP